MKKIRPDFSQISKFQEPEQSPGYLLWRISMQWRRSIEEVLKKYALTHPQFVVLASIGWLAQSDRALTQIAIGRIAGLDANTISQIIRGLEVKGLIQRAHIRDARSKSPKLTEKGTLLLSQSLPTVEAEDALFFALLSAHEAELLVGLFQKLLAKQE